MAAHATSLQPTDAADLRAAIGDAAAAGRRLMIRGGDSKGGIGADVGVDILDMRSFAGVTDYDPAELVLTAGAGTPIAEIAALTAAEGQELAFDPLDPGGATLGGVVASGLSGPLRLAHGAVRDHVLGFSAVSGRGETFVAGGRVVKNVTGFDLSKLVTGSWGRLVALTSVTIKVMPRPRSSRTLTITGLDVTRAVAAMASAMASPAEVSAAAHLPDGPDGNATTMMLLRGFEGSVDARTALLTDRLATFGQVGEIDAHSATSIWDGLRRAHDVDDTRAIWRVHLAPSRATALVDALERRGACWRMDWAGALVWAACDDAVAVRDAAARSGGHAMLVRAPTAMRATVAAAHPRAPGLDALEARVRRAFDPAGVFETGRF